MRGHVNMLPGHPIAFNYKLLDELSDVSDHYDNDIAWATADWHVDVWQALLVVDVHYKLYVRKWNYWKELCNELDKV